MIHTFDEYRDALAETYALEREIGEGGMATVYLALDHKHKRHVALKLLRSAFAEHGVAERFVREIRLTARLSHPHILPLLDSGNVLDTPFYVMPLVVGESLGDRLDREGRLPIEDAVRIATQVSDALGYAHAQGIIHRDVKPANIMLAGRHAFVADFGVAKAISSSTTEDDRTQTGMAIGTIAYMSPEQALGEQFIDARSDIFSLGAVLYEMLTGERAFGGTNAQAVLARRFSGVPPLARDKRPDVPEELERVITQSLSLEPDDRFATAADFEEALQGAMRASAFATSAPRSVEETEVLPSLAVLPFDNLSGDPDNEYLSDGITEEILTLLSRRRTIRVCARASAFSFKKHQDDVRLIGSRLGVLNVLLGSVRRATDRLRVTARLVDTRDGFQIWSERYDRTLADVFAIQDEIGESIATALNATLVGDTPAPAPTPAATRIDAYDIFLRGRAFWNQRTSTSMRKALDCFEQVIAADPTYAPAHAAIADVWVSLAVYGAAAPGEAMPKARVAAEAALAIDPALAEARVALGHVLAHYDWNFTAAGQAFRQAISLNPQLPSAHQGLATAVLTPRHKFADAVSAIRTALKMDPLSPVLRVTLSSVLLYAREYKEAVEAAKSALELDPAFAPAYFFLGRAYTHLLDFDAARMNAERSVELSGASTETLASFGYMLALAGEHDRARGIQTGLERRAAETYTSPTHLAPIPVALGEFDRALGFLEAAADVRASDLIWANVRSSFDPLRKEPRFAELMKRMGLFV
ncbi:MAG TPA: protein kinase [Gemmatimonadaceae bacterium]|nr:protein kinase [Gemmatimonadaceae bacterium]